MKHSEDKAKEVIETIAKKLNLSKRVKSVKYKGTFLWYSVHFDDNSSCAVPGKHIDDYIDSKGKSGEKEIMDCLSISVKSI